MKGSERMGLIEQKRLMRRMLKVQAAELDVSYCRKADRAIFKSITDLPEYQRAERIFCFVGTAGEIDTAPVIKDALKKGKVVGVPRCTGKGTMDACQIDGLDCLKLGRYGIMEPEETAAVLLPEDLDLVLVPCLTCSLSGKRLGYGGGYYDRYLARTRAFKAALCRVRSMREDIPAEAHDAVMDAVISEMGVRRV